MRAWMAFAAAPYVSGCAGAAVHPVGTSVDAGAPPAVTVGEGDRGVDAASLPAPIANASSSAPVAAAHVDNCNHPARETHHRVVFETTGSDVGVFRVTRDFEARAGAQGSLCLSRDVALGERSVLDSFSVQTDGTWRSATLIRSKWRGESPPPPQDGPENRPWASLVWVPTGALLLMPELPTAGTIQVRYTIWQEGRRVEGHRRWEYCAREGIEPDADAPVEMALSDHDRDLVVRGDPSESCVRVEKPEPPP